MKKVSFLATKVLGLLVFICLMKNVNAQNDEKFKIEQVKK